MPSLRMVLFMVLTLVSIVGIAVQGKPANPNPYVAIIIGVTCASIGSTSIIFLERKRLGFHAFLKNQTLSGLQTQCLLKIKTLTFREDHAMVEDENGRKIAHAFLRIRDIPYLIDDLDQNKKMLFVTAFVRLLGVLSFVFELIPRVMPVSQEAYLKKIGKEIENQKLLASSEGKL